MASNYFPIENLGTRWVYRTNSGDTINVEVTEEKAMGGRLCKVLERNTEEQFWQKEKRSLDRLYIKEINAADIYSLYIWVTELELPFILGNEWTDSEICIDTILGDRVEFSCEVEGKVVAYENIDNFGECYKVKHWERIKFSSTKFGNSDTTREILRWYAPEIGIVKTEEEGKEENLIDYEIK
jgi:hypothetical protein